MYMRLKPDYNLESIYAIDLEALKMQGIKAVLFDLDSTIMASNSGCYSAKTLEWLQKVRQDFFIGIISNNTNAGYIEKVKAVTDFPALFCARKPNPGPAKQFMAEHGLTPEQTVLVGDRPLTDILCGKNLGCKTILVDSITAETENLPTRWVRRLERCCIKK
jgi:HAD superfamily phosphatase (TIGR01668 family)